MQYYSLFLPLALKTVYHHIEEKKANIDKTMLSDEPVHYKFLG